MGNLRKGLLIEGILAFGLAVLMYFSIGLSNSMFLLTTPFDFIGKGLRWLSLSSYVGNMIALLLYLVLSLLPILYFISRRAKVGAKRSDILLPVISLYSFIMLYEFINPGLMLRQMPEKLMNESMLPMIKMSFVLIFYALFVGYLTFRMLENLTAEGREDQLNFLCKKLQFILIIVCTLYTFFVGYFTTFQMFAEFNKYIMQSNAFINCSFTILSYVLEGLPVLLIIMTINAGVKLLEAMGSHHLQNEEIRAAVQLGFISKRSVYVIILSNLILNSLQFLSSKWLSNTDYTLRISFIPLIIAFAAVILSGYFKNAKELYEDNEMII